MPEQLELDEAFVQQIHRMNLLCMIRSQGLV